MKHFLTFIVSAALLLPCPMLAAGDQPSVSPDVAALAIVHTLFAAAQETVQGSSLDPAQKATVSNILKTRHDTVKNSINNIR